MKRLTFTIALWLVALLAHAGTPTGLTLRNVANLARATPVAAGVTTSYANAGGTGNRTGTITVAASSVFYTFTGAGLPNLVNGVTSTATDFYWQAVSASGLYISFDFVTARVIDEVKYYQQNSAAQGTWQWQGSSNGSSWTDIGSSFSFGGSATQTITALAGNTTAYRYYRMLGVSGSLSNSPYVYEFEFKIY